MEPFKNIYRKESILHIAHFFEKEKLPKVSFKLKQLIPQIQNYELKERVHLIKDVLKEELPKDPLKAFKIIEKLLAPLPDRPGLGNGSDHTFALNPKGLDGFLLWPFSEYISEVGLKHINESLKLLKEITQRFTAEFAIRPFIINHPDKTYKILIHWTQDQNEHVRRLCSEGSRPKLPWGMKLSNAVKDPSAGIEILELLKYDDSLYVRKSIANHLNDISKDHPKLVIKLFKEWLKSSPKIHHNKIHWIVKHAGRTLIKKGNPEMLKILGVNHEANLSFTRIKIDRNKIKVGDVIFISGTIMNLDSKNHKLILDYKIEFTKENGRVTSKIFKGLKANLNGNEKLDFKLKVPFKNNSVRRIHIGKYAINLMINGKIQKTLFLEVI